jgi:hypothetical protein
MPGKEGVVVILILNYNSRHILDNYAASIFEQAYKDFEVLI